MPPPGLTDYTFAFGENGTILNVDNNQVFPWIDINQVSGLDTAPLRSSTDEHQGSDGTYIDTPYMSSRTIVLTGTLYTNPTDNDTLLNQLKADYNDDVVRPFYFQLPGQTTKFCNGQGGGLRYDIDVNRRLGITPVQFTVLAEDPYIYDYPSQQVSIAVPVLSILGMSFNASFNMG